MNSSGGLIPGKHDRPAHIPGMPPEMSDVEIMLLFLPNSGEYGQRKFLENPSIISAAPSHQKYLIPRFLEEKEIMENSTRLPFGNGNPISVAGFRKILELNLQQDNPLVFYVFPQEGSTGKVLLFTEGQGAEVLWSRYIHWRCSQSISNEN